MSGPNNVAGNPFAAQVPGTNVLQVFYAGTDHYLYTLWRDPIAGWNQPVPMSGPNNVGGDPIAAQVPNMNVLQVFYAGTDGGLYTLWRDPITGWNQPAPMSGAIDVRGTPEAATLPNNTNILQVFYRALDTVCTLFTGIRMRVGASQY
jgi:hypothetical protein